MQELSIS